MISCTPRGRSRLPPASANGRPPPCVPASAPRRKLQARRRRIDPMEAPQNRSDGGATADLGHGEGYRGAPQGSGHTIQPVLQVADVRPVNAKGATGAQQSECFRMLFSDGVHSLQSMLSIDLNRVVMDDTLRHGSIVHLLDSWTSCATTSRAEGTPVGVRFRSWCNIGTRIWFRDCRTEELDPSDVPG